MGVVSEGERARSLVGHASRARPFACEHSGQRDTGDMGGLGAGRSAIEGMPIWHVSNSRPDDETEYTAEKLCALCRQKPACRTSTETRRTSTETRFITTINIQRYIGVFFGGRSAAIDSSTRRAVVGAA